MATLADRPSDLRHALRLEYLTITWNIAEGLIAVTAAIAAGSEALLGFGIDSFVETASGVILIWRLRSERHMVDARAIERLDHNARRLVGASLLAWPPTSPPMPRMRCGRRSGRNRRSSASP